MISRVCSTRRPTTDRVAKCLLNPYNREHVFPEKRLEADVLIEDYGMNPERAEVIENIREKVANLQLLTSGTTLEKQFPDLTALSKHTGIDLLVKIVNRHILLFAQ